MKNEQRVLGRIMASEIPADVLADVNAGGGTLPNVDPAPGSSGYGSYTAGPTPNIRDTRAVQDWPTA